MRRFAIYAVVGLTMGLWGCSGVKVTSDTNKSTDFSKYKTYSFLGWQHGSEKLLEESDKKALHDAFIKEFEKRGMTFAKGGADMAVSLYLVLNDELSVSGYSSYYQAGGYGRYSTYGYGYYGGTSTGSFAKKKTEKGTLIMDCFDEKSGEQIWQGIANATVKEDPAKRKGSIPGRVNALMSKFPVKPVKK